MTDSNAEQPAEGQLTDRLSAPRAGPGTAPKRAVTLLRRLDSYDHAAYRWVAQLRTPLQKRYRHLVQLLRGWRAAQPLTEAAGEEAKTAAKVCREGQAKKQTNGYGRPTTTSNGCTGPGRRRSGRDTPLNWSNRPTAR
jgi:hypothetical protein